MKHYVLVTAFVAFASFLLPQAVSACADLPNICAMAAQRRADEDRMEGERALQNTQNQNAEYGAGAPYEPTHVYDDGMAEQVSSAKAIVQAMAADYKAMMVEAQKPEFLAGKWVYPGSELNPRPADMICSALFTRRSVGLALLGPPKGEKSASMMFFSPDIPPTTANNKVPVSLKQSGGPAQNTTAVHMPFNASFGSLIFYVPTMQLLTDNMYEKETFDVIMNGKSVAEIEWTGGLAAKNQLTTCMKR
ncbi:MAG: hypothetical protein V4621_05765 [Pseudomonadota bacterium]